MSGNARPVTASAVPADGVRHTVAHRLLVGAQPGITDP
jgi:hypothetical protein